MIWLNHCQKINSRSSWSNWNWRDRKSIRFFSLTRTALFVLRDWWFNRTHLTSHDWRYELVDRAQIRVAWWFRMILFDDSEWLSSRSFESDLLIRRMQCFSHQWSQKLELSESYVDAETSTQWKSHQCKSWSSVKVAFTSAMSMTVIEWKCWKVRWQKTEEWTRMKSRLLIDRLSEACQDRSLLETLAQSIYAYFCT